MRYSISNTAEYGDLTRGEKVVGDATRTAMKEVLARIQDGSFAREWMAENKSGGKNFSKLRQQAAQHPIEKVGEQLRAMMSWLPSKIEPNTESNFDKKKTTEPGVSHRRKLVNA